VERRQAKRNPIEVDIEIAHPGIQRCYGCTENISRNGVLVRIWKGNLPMGQRAVILNFKVRTGSETLYRKIYARVVRSDEISIGLEFVEHDFIAEAIIQDLMYHQSRERQQSPRRPAGQSECMGEAVAAAVEPV